MKRAVNNVQYTGGYYMMLIFVIVAILILLISMYVIYVFTSAADLRKGNPVVAKKLDDEQAEILAQMKEV